jgi:nitrate reductase beta subunit
MDIRSQVSMVFHLDKCIGCHTCSIACKNIWTDRKGAEYMWWNNVETKPGTGYPTLWEDQQKYRGGWEVVTRGSRRSLRLRLQSRLGELADIFYNPALPNLDDYYEPFTYRYQDLFTAPPGDDQPIARAISMVDGRTMEIEAGPNWDDDLGGSPIYAAHDPQMDSMTEEEQQKFFEFERLVFFYVPRICNHCLNPGCVAACPAGAIYKRGEDGIVLVSQEKCRAWRMCISGCPYKKVYFNWSTGKSEKCILCYPRQETGQAPACFHVCVGRIRYLGVLLYDADQIEQAAMVDDHELVEAQREMIMDPHDPQVIAAASKNGIPDGVISAAQKSPVYRFVKEWKLALPLHPEFRTIPMLFYVPPLLPVVSAQQADGQHRLAADFFSSLESTRMPIHYMARLLAGGNEAQVRLVYQRLMAVRITKRSQEVGDFSNKQAEQALSQAGITADQVEEIYHLTTQLGYYEHFVIPPMRREVAIESTIDPQVHKAEAGFGFRRPPKRGA